jgi:AraC-like DNA-binding protein
VAEAPRAFRKSPGGSTFDCQAKGGRRMKLTSMEATYAQNRRGEHDVLSDVLRAVRLTSALFYDNEARGSWVSETPDVAEYARLAMPEAELVIPFKVITAGSCFAELVDRSAGPIRLGEGDVVVISRGDRHVLASSPGMREDEAADIEDYRRPDDGGILRAVINESGSGAAACRFVCGFFGCDAGPFNPLLDALPKLWRAPAATSVRMIQSAVAETDDHRTGSQTLLAKLGEVLFVEVIRNHISELPAESRGWLSALRDRHVGAALGVIHRRPTDDWTIDRLAREVGLSRSTFAERFVRYVGFPPMNYLAQWRMQLAVRTLERPGSSVAQAAASVGYQSEAAFRRAFERYVGVSPSAWRKRSAA